MKESIKTYQKYHTEDSVSQLYQASVSHQVEGDLCHQFEPTCLWALKEVGHFEWQDNIISTENILLLLHNVMHVG